MKRDLNLFLEDIIEQIELIESNFIDNKDELSKDINLRDATVRRLEIIGAAVKNLPMNFRDKYPEVEWKKIAGTRDIIIHAYFRVDLDAVWDIIKKNLPKLKKQINKILEEESKE